MSETTPIESGPFILTATFDDICYITETDEWPTDPWDPSVKEFDSVEEAKAYIKDRFPNKFVGIRNAAVARDDYGPSLQRRGGSELESETTRPEWANGPEWKGWSFNPVKDSADYMARRSVTGRLYCIFETGYFEIEEEGIEAGELCLSIDAALNVANTLAEAAGGWE